MIGKTSWGNAARILDKACFCQWAADSRQGTPPIVNQVRNPNFRRGT